MAGAAVALGLAAALGSPLIAATAVVLAVGGLMRHRFVAAIGGAAVALNPGWGLLFILATPYLVLAVVLAVRARRDFEAG